MLTMVSPTGKTTRYLDYDDYGNARRVVDPVGNVVDQTFDSRSRLRTKDVKGGGTPMSHQEITYDSLDRKLTTVTRELLVGAPVATTSNTYYPGGQLKTAVNSLGHTTRYILEPGTNRVQQKIDERVLQADLATRKDIVSQYAYDEAGNVVRETQIRNPSETIILQHSYDKLNRRERTQLLPGVGGPVGFQSGTIMEAKYDLVGHRTSHTDLYGHVTIVKYDGLYRAVEMTLPVASGSGTGQATIHMGYDLVGNKVLETDANGKPTRFTYDTAYRLTDVTDPLGNVVHYDYDRSSRIVKETHKSSGVTTLETIYDDGNEIADGLGRPSTKKEIVTLGDPSGGAGKVEYVTAFAYNDAQSLVLLTDARGVVSERRSDGLGRTHRQSVDVNGLNLVTTFTHDAMGNVKTISDSQNNDIDITYTYDGLGRKVRATYVGTADDSGAVSEQYFYDGANNLIRTIDKRGIEFITTYDGINRVLSQTVVESKSNGGAPLQLLTKSYDDAAHKVTTVDANGNTTVATMDGKGRVIGFIDAELKPATAKYDGVNKIEEVDRRGIKSVYVYDDLNRLVRTEEYDESGALRSTIKSQYLDDKLQTITTDRNEVEVIEQRDSLGRVAKVSRRHSELAAAYGVNEVILKQQEFDGNNNLLLLKDGEGNQTKFIFDDANRLEEMVEGFGSSVQASTFYTHDGVGNVLTVKDGRASGAAFDVSNTYDARYRRASSENGAGEKTIYHYDAANNLVSMTEPRGAAYTTRYVYGEFNELLAVDESDRGGGATIFIYDANRNRIAQQDANRNLVTHKYDVLNRVTDTFQHTTAGSLVVGSGRGSVPTGGAGAVHWQFGYDLGGNQNLVIDPLLQRTERTHDYLNRLKQTTYSNHANPPLDYQPLSVSFGYDGNGNVLSAVEQKLVGGAPVSQSYVFGYDKMNRQTDVKNPDNKTIHFEYYKQGNRKSVTADNLTTTYVYDGRNRLDTVATEAGTTDYEFWEDNLIKKITYPNGVVADYAGANAYDAADRLTHIVNKLPGGSTLSTFAYTYDVNGNRKSQTESHAGINLGQADVTTYDYDTQNRLTQVAYGSTRSLTYTHDNVGNRLTEIGVDPATGQQVNRSLAYDRLNRLVSVTNHHDAAKSVAYSYDANGNRIARTIGEVTTSGAGTGNPVVSIGSVFEVTPYHYNNRNQLVKTIDGAGGNVTFDYDPSGMRILKQSSAGQTRYLYDGNSTLLEYDATGQTTAKYNYGYHLLSRTDVDPAAADPRASQFFLYDGLGSTSELTNEAGTAQITYQYDAWGNLRNTVGSSDNPKQFTGHELDPETGLIYAGARYYDSTTGTFITQDSYLGQAQTPPSLHRYSYAHANPLTYIDPTGHSVEKPNVIERGMHWNAENKKRMDEQHPTLAAINKVEHIITMPFTFGVEMIGSMLVGAASATADIVQEGSTSDRVLMFSPIAPLIVIKQMVKNMGSQIADRYDKVSKKEGSGVVGALAAAGDVVGYTKIWEGLRRKTMEGEKLGILDSVEHVEEGLLNTVAFFVGAWETGGALRKFLKKPPAGKPPLVGPSAEPAGVRNATVPGAEPPLADAPGGSFDPSKPLRVDVAMTLDEVKNLDNNIFLKEHANGVVTKGEAVAGTFDPKTGTIRNFQNVDGPWYDMVQAHETSHRYFHQEAGTWSEANRMAQPDMMSPQTRLENQAIAIYIDEAIAFDNGYQVARRLGIRAPFDAFTDAFGSMTPEQAELARKVGIDVMARELGIQGLKDMVFRDRVTGPIELANHPHLRQTGSKVGSGTNLAEGSQVGPGAIDLAQLMTWWRVVEPSIELTLSFEDLPGAQLGEARVITVDANGLPTAGTIVIDRDAAGIGWFVDSTPLDNSEFGTPRSSTALVATNNSAAAGKYDLQTVVLHEMGHLLGFDPSISGFAAHIGAMSGSTHFVSPDFVAKLSDGADHLDNEAHPHDLMNALLAPSVRKLPSELDRKILNTTRQSATAQPVTRNAFKSSPLALSAAAFSAIVNGDFTLADPAAAGFGWSRTGSVAIDQGQAVLTENTQVLSGLSQTFTIPAGATDLSFTLADIDLAPNTLILPDAFEVALVNSATGASLLGPITGLSNTDAVLNIQQTGEVFYATGVSFPGATTSGNIAALDTPLVFTISLAGVATGTTATMYFDLLGFGATGSSVRIDNIEFVGIDGNDPPSAAADSGQVGENAVLTVTAPGVLANDIDLDQGDTKAVIAVNGQATAIGTQITLPSGAKLTLAANGNYTYDPSGRYETLAAGQSATDTFAYTMSDSAGAVSTATVAITIQGANDAPAATNDIGSTSEDEVLIVPVTGLLANDTDVDSGDTKIVTAVNGSAAAIGNPIVLTSGATLTVAADGSYRYDPRGKFDTLRPGQTSTESFTYSMADAAGVTSSATATITIQGVNDSPQAVNDAASTAESAVLVITAPGMLINDTDADLGDNKSVTALNGQTSAIGTQITLASGALLTVQADGSYRYDPNGRFNSLTVGQSATDSFTYTMADGAGMTSTGTVIITIEGVDGGALAVNDVSNTTEEQTLFVPSPGVLANDAGATKSVVAVNGQPVSDSVEIVLTSGARLLVLNDGSYLFNPSGKYEHLRAGQTTTESFSYTLSDGQGGNSTATVTITIQGLNDLPQAILDSVFAAEDQPLIIPAAGLLANDTDADSGDTKTVTAVNGQASNVGAPILLPSGAIITVQADGSYRYDPNRVFEAIPLGDSATDSFTYTMSDAAGATSTATAIVTVQGANDAPATANDSNSIDENSVLIVSTEGLLINDVDRDIGDTKAITAINGQTGVGSPITLASGALLTVAADGTYRYDPRQRFDSLRSGQTATETFTYTMSDAAGATSTASVTITIQGANDPPTAANDTGVASEDQPLLVTATGLLANDIDLDSGDAKLITAVNGLASSVGSSITLPSGALVAVNADGSYRYDPNRRFESLRLGQSAIETFTYTMADAAGAASTATATITIQGQNDTPAATTDTGTIDENTVLLVGAVGVLANDTDPDAGDTKSVVAVNGQLSAIGMQLLLTSGALVAVQADGSYRYDPNGKFSSLANGESATDLFEYTIADGQGATATATVTITIVGVSTPNPTLANSISGSVYVDVNNNGLRGVPEMGLRYVMVHLDGPVSRTVQTDLDGRYAFTSLPPGVYSVRQAHPQAFIDGIDTRGLPLLGTAGNDRFDGIQLTSNLHAVGYDFGERGLTNPNKKLNLASTSLDWNLILPPLPNDQLEVLWARQFGSPLLPVMYSTQNPVNSLDVSGDGKVTPKDVLIVINHLNAGLDTSSSSLRLQESAAPYLDTTGDGIVTPADALKVINHINSGLLFEGEGEMRVGASPNLESEEQSTELDCLLDVLAEDICEVRKKKTTL